MLTAGKLRSTPLEVCQFVLRGMVSPPMLIAFAVAATAPLWIPAAIYLYLRSIELTGSNLILSIGLIVSVLASLFFFVLFFAEIIRGAKPLKELRKRAEAGEVTALQEYKKRRLRSVPYLWRFMFAYIFLKLVIPAAVATVVWSTTPPGAEKIRGHWVATTRVQELGHRLRYMEGKGISQWWTQ